MKAADKSSNKDKKVFVNSIFYTINGMLQNCFSFFLLPLYTAYLSTSDYGVVSIAENFLAVMSYLCAFSVYTAVNRFYVDYKDNPETLKRFYGTVTVFVFLSSVAYGVLFTVFRSALSRLVFSSTSFYPIIFVCLIEIIFHCQRMIYESVLQSQQRAGTYSIISFTLFVVKVLLTVYFVVFRRMGAIGIILAATIHVFLFFIVYMADVLRHRAITFCIDCKILKTTLKYSIPIMPHNLSTQIATLVAKVLIGGKASLATLGVFSIASKFGEVSDVIQNYVNNAYGPWLYEKLHAGEGDYKKNIRKTSGLLVSVIGLCCIGLALFSQEVIVLLIDPSYVEAWRYIPLIVGVYVIKITYYFYVSILFYYKAASKKLFIATLTGSIINVILSSFLIPRYGVYGSIVADAISMVVRVSIVVFISSKYENIGLSFFSFIAQECVILLFIFVGMLYTIISKNSALSFVNIIYKGGVCIVYLLLNLFVYKDAIKDFKRN